MVVVVVGGTTMVQVLALLPGDLSRWVEINKNENKKTRIRLIGLRSDFMWQFCRFSRDYYIQVYFTPCSLL